MGIYSSETGPDGSFFLEARMRLPLPGMGLGEVLLHPRDRFTLPEPTLGVVENQGDRHLRTVPR